MTRRHCMAWHTHTHTHGMGFAPLTCTLCSSTCAPFCTAFGHLFPTPAFAHWHACLSLSPSSSLSLLSISSISLSTIISLTAFLILPLSLVSSFFLCLSLSLSSLLLSLLYLLLLLLFFSSLKIAWRCGMWRRGGDVTL